MLRPLASVSPLKWRPLWLWIDFNHVFRKKAITQEKTSLRASGKISFWTVVSVGFVTATTDTKCSEQHSTTTPIFAQLLALSWIPWTTVTQFVTQSSSRKSRWRIPHHFDVDVHVQLLMSFFVSKWTSTIPFSVWAVWGSVCGCESLLLLFCEYITFHLMKREESFPTFYKRSSRFFRYDPLIRTSSCNFHADDLHTPTYSLYKNDPIVKFRRE